MVGLVMFFLQYGLPSVWQTKPDAGVTANTNLGSGQMAIVLLALLGYAFLSLRLEIGIFVREMRNEWLLPAFLGLAFVSTTWSADPNFTFSISVALFVVLLLGYWMATRFTVATLLGVLGWVFAAGSTVSVVMINVFPDYAISAQGWTGLLKNRNLFGQSCVLAVVVFLFCARIHRRWRVPAYAFAGMNVWFVIGSESKTSLVAVIAMPIMMLTFVVFRARRTLYAAVAVIMTLLAGALVVVAMSIFPAITDVLERESNLTGRTQIWEAVIEQIRLRPWFGYGWKGFWNEPYGAAKPITLVFGGPVAHSHNAAVEHALNLGVVGLALSLALFLRLVIRGARVIRFYQGAVGLFPLVFAGFVLTVSITEVGVFERNLNFLLFVVAVTTAARGRRDVVAAIAITESVHRAVPARLPAS